MKRALLTLMTALIADAAPTEIKIHRNGPAGAAAAGSYSDDASTGIRIIRARGSSYQANPAKEPGDLSGARPSGRLQHSGLFAEGLADKSKTALLARIADAYLPQILTASRRYQVPSELIMGVIAIESAGRVKAVSPKGAMGLMQLMPETARRMQVRDAFSPDENINGGTRLLSRLIDLYNGDPVLVLAAYNAGEGAVAKHNGVPPFKEPRDYIPKVLGAAAAATAVIGGT